MSRIIVQVLVKIVGDDRYICFVIVTGVVRILVIVSVMVIQAM